MKTIRNIINVATAGSLLCLGFAVTSCKDNFTEPATPKGNTIVQVASANDSLKAFVTALNRTGLATTLGNLNNAQFTAFAPSNYSFVKYLRSAGFVIGKTDATNAGDSAVKALNKIGFTPKTGTTISLNGAGPNGTKNLASVIDYHLISSGLSAITGTQSFYTMSTTSGVTARLSLSNVNGATFPLQINANIASVGANIIDNGTAASNGVVYTIDRVMTPISTANIWASNLLNFSINYGVSPYAVSIGSTVIPKDATDNTGTYYNVATAPVGSSAADTAKYTLYTAALVRAGLASTILLNGVAVNPDFTVFAPTDGAFFRYLNTDLSSGVNAAAYSSARSAINAMDGATLANIVRYHIYNGRILSTDLTSSQSVATLLSGKSFTVNINGSAYSITDLNGSSQDAAISSANNLTNAGVLHGIRRVLLPE